MAKKNMSSGVPRAASDMGAPTVGTKRTASATNGDKPATKKGRGGMRVIPSADTPKTRFLRSEVGEGVTKIPVEQMEALLAKWEAMPAEEKATFRSMRKKTVPKKTEAVAVEEDDVPDAKEEEVAPAPKTTKPKKAKAEKKTEAKVEEDDVPEKATKPKKAETKVEEDDVPEKEVMAEVNYGKAPSVRKPFGTYLKEVAAYGPLMPMAELNRHECGFTALSATDLKKLRTTTLLANSIPRSAAEQFAEYNCIPLTKETFVKMSKAVEEGDRFAIECIAANVLEMYTWGKKCSETEQKLKKKDIVFEIPASARLAEKLDEDVKKMARLRKKNGLKSKPNAYNIFMSDKEKLEEAKAIAAKRAEEQGLSHLSHIGPMSEMWNNMTPAEKKKYTDILEQQVADGSEERDAFQEAMDSIPKRRIYARDLFREVLGKTHSDLSDSEIAALWKTAHSGEGPHARVAKNVAEQFEGRETKEQYYDRIRAWAEGDDMRTRVVEDKIAHLELSPLRREQKVRDAIAKDTSLVEDSVFHALLGFMNNDVKEAFEAHRNFRKDEHAELVKSVWGKVRAAKGGAKEDDVAE